MSNGERWPQIPQASPAPSVSGAQDFWIGLSTGHKPLATVTRSVTLAWPPMEPPVSATCIQLPGLLKCRRLQFRVGKGRNAPCRDGNQNQKGRRGEWLAGQSGICCLLSQLSYTPTQINRIQLRRWTASLLPLLGYEGGGTRLAALNSWIPSSGVAVFETPLKVSGTPGRDSRQKELMFQWGGAGLRGSGSPPGGSPPRSFLSHDFPPPRWRSVCPTLTPSGDACSPSLPRLRKKVGGVSLGADNEHVTAARLVAYGERLTSRRLARKNRKRRSFFRALGGPQKRAIKHSHRMTAVA